MFENLLTFKKTFCRKNCLKSDGLLEKKSRSRLRDGEKYKTQQTFNL